MYVGKKRLISIATGIKIQRLKKFIRQKYNSWNKGISVNSDFRHSISTTKLFESAVILVAEGVCLVIKDLFCFVFVVFFFAVSCLQRASTSFCTLPSTLPAFLITLFQISTSCFDKHLQSTIRPMSRVLDKIDYVQHLQ